MEETGVRSLLMVEQYAHGHAKQRVRSAVADWQGEQMGLEV